MSNQEILENINDGITKASKTIAIEIIKKEMPLIGNTLSISSKINNAFDYVDECSKTHSNVACVCGAMVRNEMKTVINTSSIAMIETPLIISQVAGVAGLMCSDKVSKLAGNVTANIVDYINNDHSVKRQYDSEIPIITNSSLRKYDSEIPIIYEPKIYENKQIQRTYNNLTPKQFGDFTSGLVEYCIKNIPYEKIEPNSSLVIKNDKYVLKYNPKDVKFFHELIKTNQLVNRAVTKLQNSTLSTSSKFSETVSIIKTDTIKFNNRTHKIKMDLDSHCEMVHTFEHLRSNMRTLTYGSYDSRGKWSIGITYTAGRGGCGGSVSCIIL